MWSGGLVEAGSVLFKVGKSWGRTAVGDGRCANRFVTCETTKGAMEFRSISRNDGG